MKSSVRDFVLYFFNLLVKNSIIKKTPNIYQYGDVSQSKNIKMKIKMIMKIF